MRDSFKKWKKLGIGLEFKEVNDPAQAKIRIAFESGGGSWSYAGKRLFDRKAYIGMGVSGKNKSGATSLFL